MRLIRVLHNFGGHVTNDRRIEPGLYPEDDSRLFGAADYLIQNGHAELAGVLADPQPVAEETLPPAEETLPPAEETGGEGGEQSPADETGGEGGEQAPVEDSPAGEPPAEEDPAPTKRTKKA